MADTDDINITNPKKDEPDLYKRSIKGGYWIMSSRFAVQLLGFLKSLFIVNFFLLNDLGIIGASVMLMDILNTFSQTGFESALIQKKGDIHAYLDTAWTVGLVKGIVLFLILFFAAPVLATFRIPEEKVPLAIGVFRAMSACFLIRGFRNIGPIYFSKNLDFHKTFVLSMVSTLADIVLSVGFVLIFRSIWGVVAARLLTTCVGCGGTYFLSSYRPRLHFERAKARELWHFGRWIFGGNIVGFLIGQGDDFFVWFYLGIQPLALYRTAFRFATIPATHITQVISEVSYPAYSKIQNDLPRLKEAYLKILKITAFFSVPAAFLIFILGPDFVQLFLREHLHPMTFTLQLLALKGLMGSISSTYSPVFKALGKPRILWYLAILCLIILAITIYPFTKLWGIAGTALSTILYGVLVNPLYFLLTCKMLHCPRLKLLQQFLFPLCTSILMSMSLLIGKTFFFEKTTFISFFILVIISTVIYLLLSLLLDIRFNFGLRQLLRENIQLFAKRMPGNKNEVRTV